MGAQKLVRGEYGMKATFDEMIATGINDRGGPSARLLFVDAQNNLAATTRDNLALTMQNNLAIVNHNNLAMKEGVRWLQLRHNEGLPML